MVQRGYTSGTYSCCSFARATAVMEAAGNRCTQRTGWNPGGLSISSALTSKGF